MADRRPLLAYLAVQRRVDRELAVDLARAARDASEQIERLGAPGRAIREAQLRRALAQIRDGQRELWRAGVLPRVVAGRGLAMTAAHDVMDAAAEYLYRRLPAGEAERVREGLNATARVGLEAAIARVPRALSARVYRNQALATGAVERRIRSGIARGLNARELAGEVRRYISPSTRGGVAYAAMRLARTELAAAFRERSLIDADQRPGVLGAKWNLSNTHPKPDGCDVNAARPGPFGPGTYKIPDYPELVHPHCFPAGTMVTVPAGQLVSATCRWYSGELVRVFATEGSIELAGTPNHPALTPRGWVPLGQLREGDYVLGAPGADRTPVEAPHNHGVPSRIEQVFESSLGSSGMVSARVSVSAVDFHGDGVPETYVDIVRSDSLLGDSFAEEVEHSHLSLADVELLALASLGGLDLSLHRDWDAPVDGMGLLHSLRHILGSMQVGGLLAGPEWATGPLHGESNSAHWNSEEFGCGAEGEGRFVRRDHCGFLDVGVLPVRVGAFVSGILDGSIYDGLADGRGGRDLFDTLSRDVPLHRIDRIEVSSFGGHVYNLETSEGWYTANGITVHNCLCYMTPVHQPPADFARAVQRGDFDDEIARRLAERRARAR